MMMIHHFSEQFWDHLGSILVPLWCSWVALGVLWAVWGRPWALRGALGTPLGNPWPLLGLSGGARGAFMGPFLGHTCPHLVAMLNKLAPNRNACAHPAKSSARSKIFVFRTFAIQVQFLGGQFWHHFLH